MKKKNVKDKEVSNEPPKTEGKEKGARQQ